ncbi:hypothetical protein [Pseudoxanthomonas composti]|uniref:Uncharacterized protein n=1 Tax=Pseudoxanthomonas composti TaxID=2137479 RepID=A0A4Q1JXW0_9GAMM|nr:hypothetical protein [Pseudoxanthomonas composti]RXR06650.1 hypothetical protein EPA99_08430 [Pseudoxanthomonas composti]
MNIHPRRHAVTVVDAPAAVHRPRPAWIGLALLALWLGWILPSLAALQRTPVVAAGLDAAEITLHLRKLGATPGQPGQATAVFLQGGHCRCSTQGDDTALRAALQGQAIQVRTQAIPSTALPFALVVFDASGALRYAGPLDIATGCGRQGVPAGPLIASVLASDRPPFLSPAPCPCSEANAT